MIIAIASGKGGTGKTTVAVSLALSIEKAQLVDCDVEEPNSHIFLRPEIATRLPAHIPVPQIDESRCTFCGRCKQVCAYNAIAVFPGAEGKKGQVLVFPQLCHGCGACAYLCPEHAITEQPREIGVVEIGASRGISFVHGTLAIGEAMAPPLIRQVQAHIDRSRTVIIDAPPGTSCPAVTAVSPADVCLLVTEPTPFGLHDLRLAVEVLRKLGLPFGVAINRSDLGDDKTEAFCGEEHIPVLLRLPFEERIAAAYARGVPLIEAAPQYAQAFKDTAAQLAGLAATRPHTNTGV